MQCNMLYCIQNRIPSQALLAPFFASFRLMGLGCWQNGWQELSMQLSDFMIANSQSYISVRACRIE